MGRRKAPLTRADVYPSHHQWQHVRLDILRLWHIEEVAANPEAFVRRKLVNCWKNLISSPGPNSMRRPHHCFLLHVRQEAPETRFGCQVRDPYPLIVLRRPSIERTSRSMSPRIHDPLQSDSRDDWRYDPGGQSKSASWRIAPESSWTRRSAIHG